MKNLLLLFFVVTNIVFASDDKTKSSLKEVTVYLNGAQITRTASISLNSGTTKFVFGRLSPNIVESSIQVSGLRDASILSINYKAFEIELKNNKLTTIDLILYDRIPISQNKDIKLDNIETGSSDYDDKKGLMKWKIKLNSKASSKKRFSYTVKFPKYKRINL